MNKPKVSVIMPVYNEDLTILNNAIDCIISQSFKDFEFIIIDDGSRYRFNHLIDSFNDKRIKYHRLEKNSKIVVALNTGIELATGDYIAIMNSDDYSYPTRLEKQFEILEKNPNVGLVTSFATINYKGEDYSYSIPTESEQLKKFVKYIKNILIHPSIMLRKSILTDNNINYRQEYLYAEDHKLWSELADICDFYVIPEVLVVYNRADNTSRQNLKTQQKIAKTVLLENYSKALKNKKIMDFSKEYYNKARLSYKNYITLYKELDKLLKKIKKETTPSFYYYFRKNLTETIELYNTYGKYDDANDRNKLLF